MKGSVTVKTPILTGLLMTALLFVPPLLFTPETAAVVSPTEEKPPVPVQEQTPDTVRHDADVKLRVWDGKEVHETTLAEYLPGVVRGEMPATFEPAALAAQAAAERTYIYYHLQGQRKKSHPDADVCTDSGCCSAWMSQEEARKRWGDRYEEYEAKVDRAVAETDGQIILYDGAPILAVFHSSSAGATAASGQVWSADLPYLRSVSSPETEDTVPNYYSVTTLSAGEFRSSFLASFPKADLSGDPAGWITGTVKDDSGRVERITVGGVTVSGTELRAVFSLRSTAFTVSAEGEKVTFRVTGYGHGVGMSQYGANELARQGKTWQEILQWYYTGVTIGPAA
ncbi:MAG: stage II sporulation protein D [Oscillospiraceae bacterium]|jgi:stage II sporulation protein D|nr:stage II sporulation protein D [Oscillospiraceae bacterium]